MPQNNSKGWPDPHPNAIVANNEFMLLVGKIIREFAHLEMVLADCLAALLKTDHWRARIVLSSMPNIRARRELLETLAATYLEHDLSEFNADLSSLKHLANKRNVLAHYFGGLDADDPRYVFFVSDNDQTQNGNMIFGKETKYQLSNLPTWGKEMRELLFKFQSWPERLAKAHTSPKMHREQSELS